MPYNIYDIGPARFHAQQGQDRQEKMRWLMNMMMMMKQMQQQKGQWEQEFGLKEKEFGVYSQAQKAIQAQQEVARRAQ